MRFLLSLRGWELASLLSFVYTGLVAAFLKRGLPPSARIRVLGGSVAGLLLTAIFLLTLMQRIFHGPLNEKWGAIADLTLRERLLVAPAIALMFVLGIYPQLLIGLFNATMTQLAENLKF